MRLPRARIDELLTVYGRPLSALEMDRVEAYLALLLRWNARMNLTAIRAPEEIIRRHFGESFFLEQYLLPCSSLLDLGSGAGFPGLPVQICRPELAVTLAESQSKKAAFLREAVRVLELNTEVWAAPAEIMPLERRFEAVCLRAVDKPILARTQAAARLASGGSLLELAGPERPGVRRIQVPNSLGRYLFTSQSFHVEPESITERTQ